MNTSFPPYFSCFSLKDYIQFPKHNKLLLILAPSLSLMPLLLVFDALSEPAKSTKDNLAIFISSSIP